MRFGVCVRSFILCVIVVFNICKSQGSTGRLQNYSFVLTLPLMQTKNTLAYFTTQILDYVNSVLYGTSTKQITRLQRVQNALARVVVPNRPPGYSLHLLKQLHWLPVEWRIKFKIVH